MHPFASTRRAAARGVTVAVAGSLALAGFAVARAAHWNPLSGIHAPHLPPVSQTVKGPSESTLILQHLQTIGTLHVEDATYNWGKTISSSHKLFGLTTGTAKHSVNLVATVPIAVDVGHAAFAIPADKELVLYLPPPTPGTPTINPSQQTQVDSCATHVPILDGLAGLSFSRSCQADALTYQAEAVKAITTESQHDTAVVAGARIQTGALLACLVQPTGWAVQVAWTDQPTPATFAADQCVAPLTQRLPPVAPIP